MGCINCKVLVQANIVHSFYMCVDYIKKAHYRAYYTSFLTLVVLCFMHFKAKDYYNLIIFFSNAVM